MPRTPINPLLTTSLTPSGSPEPAYIYALSLLPSTICALTSASTLHLLSTHTLQPTRVLTTPHTLLATYSPHTLLTSGQSKTLTLHDLRTPTPTITSLLSPSPTTSLAVSPSGLLAAGTELVSSTSTVLIFDPRYPTAPVRTYSESHSDDITALSFSSLHPHLLASGGTDAQVNVFDVSVSAGTGVEGDDEVDGALRTTINHGSSVNRVGFLGENLWAVSHDEVMGVYAGNGEGETHMLGDVREKTGAEYVVDVVGGEKEAWVVAG
ncbi:WD40 repeat-like protein, partial [Wilcoxina mikolae CBS 423.85]